MWRVFLGPVLFLTSCVAYRAQPITLESVATDVASRPGVRVDFAAAVRLVHGANPDLKRLAAEARAAGLDVLPAAGAASANTRSEVVGATADLLQLVRIGPRGAAAKAAHARRVEALAALRAAEQRMAAEIAEVFAVERVLRGRTVPEFGDEGARFREAGLASEADVKRFEFARTAARAETTAIVAERTANRARFRKLAGLPPAATVEFELPDGPAFPEVPDATRRRILDRPDLARTLAAYQVADADFRRAVAEQYPTLQLGGEIEWDAGGAGGLVSLRIPLGAARPARAAGERREAARLAVEAALLEAYREVDARTARNDAAAARALAFAQRAAAAAALREVAFARLETEPDAFHRAADMASLAIRTAIVARETAVAAARARVALAAAYGWPRKEEIR